MLITLIMFLKNYDNQCYKMLFTFQLILSTQNELDNAAI